MLRNSNRRGRSPLFLFPLCFPKKQHAHLHVSMGFYCLLAWFSFNEGEKLLPHWPLFPVLYTHPSGAYVFRERESVSHYCQLCQRCALYSALSNYSLGGIAFFPLRLSLFKITTTFQVTCSLAFCTTKTQKYQTSNSTISTV